MGGVVRTAAVLALAAVAVLVAGGLTAAKEARADAAVVPGYDISWPQCNKQYPPGPVAFAIIGINNGRPYTANPCFLDQYRWASRVERNPAVYVNVEYPKDGRPEALTGPYGACQETDAWCRAYNYGYGISREAVTRANASGVHPGTWWLDVETGNFWSDDPTYNAQVVRAAIDYLRERNLPVGIYSTPRQWGIIAGGYRPELPVWTAGAQGVDGAARRCNASYAFGGGTVHLVQYYDYGYDTNFICPGSDLLLALQVTDPFGRPGPSGRSFSPAGRDLPFWSVLPALSK